MLIPSTAALWRHRQLLAPLDRLAAVLAASRPAYWQSLAVAAALRFARVDAAFVALRAKEVMPRHMVPVIFFLPALAEALLSAPLAKLSGAGGAAARTRLLALGVAAMAAADALFVWPASANPPGMFLGAALIGLHMALTHALSASLVASHMPAGGMEGAGKLLGTAVSLTDLVLGETAKWVFAFLLNARDVMPAGGMWFVTRR